MNRDSDRQFLPRVCRTAPFDSQQYLQLCFPRLRHPWSASRRRRIDRGTPHRGVRAYAADRDHAFGCPLWGAHRNPRRNGCLRATWRGNRAISSRPRSTCGLARRLSPRRLVANGRAGSQPVKGLTIFMEGGGNSSRSKAALRHGMDQFLQEAKSAARKKGLRWKLICCGGRSKAFSRFRNSSRN